MRSAIAELLRSLSNRGLVVLGLACLGVAGAVIAALEPRGARPYGSILALISAVGVVALGIAAVRFSSARLAAMSPARRLTWIAAVAAVLLIAAFSTYSLAFYWKDTMHECNDALYGAGYGRNLAERRAALDRGNARLRSPFSLLPELIGFRVSQLCEMAQRDFDRMERGLCPYEMDEKIPCICGAERWPEDGRCRESVQCVVDGNPERLRCPSDPW